MHNGPKTTTKPIPTFTVINTSIPIALMTAEMMVMMTETTTKTKACAIFLRPLGARSCNRVPISAPLFAASSIISDGVLTVPVNS
ncbi:hypothetical protein D3C72_2250260 [compost metagenome]